MMFSDFVDGCSVMFSVKPSTLPLPDAIIFFEVPFFLMMKLWFPASAKPDEN
jgi:hypothetical protein